MRSTQCLRGVRSRDPWRPLQIRSFSISAPQRKRRVLFPEVTTPELATHLQDVLYKVIVPSGLPRKELHRLRSPLHADSLKASPVKVEVDGVEFTYNQTLGPTQSSPPLLGGATDMVTKATSLMKTRDDWSALPILLAGLSRANRGVVIRKVGAVASTAQAAGQLGVVVQCVQQAATTGLALRDSKTLLDLLVVNARDAAASGWDAAVTAKALRRAELLLETAEEEIHVAAQEKRRTIAAKKMLAASLSAGDDSTVTEQDMQLPPLHRDPLVLSQVLALAAIEALRANGDAKAAAVAKVRGYAERVAAEWPAAKTPMTLFPPVFYQEKLAYGYLVSAHYIYQGISYTAASAFELASELLGQSDPELAAHLRSCLEPMRAEVQQRLTSDVPSEQMAELRAALGRVKEMVAEGSTSAAA